MEIVRSLMKNNTLGLLFGLCVVLFVTEISGMLSRGPELTPQKHQRQAEKMDQFAVVFVKTNDDKIVPVSLQNINQMKVLLVLLEHQRGKNSKENPINATMITASELLLLNDALNAMSRNEFEEFYYGLAKEVGVGVKLPNLLGEGKLRMLINAAQKVEAIGLSTLCSSYFLPLDMQKLLIPTFINFSVDCLKNQIIEKYAQGRKIDLVGHPAQVNVAAFSSNGKKIISGCHGNQDNLIVWDISDINNVTHKVLIGHPDDVSAVALSSDGKRIVSGCLGDQDNLILWDSETGKKIQNLTGHPSHVNTVAFSSDGKRIISGCHGDHGDQDNLILWDISDIDNIAHKVLTGNEGSVWSVAFSPDNKKIVVGSDFNLIVWDISDSNDITHKMLKSPDFPLSGITTVAFSPDGKKIVSGSTLVEDSKPNFIVWDISDSNNITYEVIARSKYIDLVSFCSSGTRIMSRNALGDVIMWNISDIKHVTRTDFEQKLGFVLALSSDCTRSVSPGVHYDESENLILWTLLNDQEASILNNLNNCTVVQARLLYQLCLALQQGIAVKLTNTDAAVFNTLPDLVRNLLQGVVQASQKME